MDNINDILGFHFNADTFAKMGKNVINNGLVSEVEKKTSELHEISNQFDVVGIGVDKSIDIDGILRKINAQNQLPELTMRDEKKVLRTLCYYLSEIKSEVALIAILHRLDEKWANSFLLGLIDYVFQFWNPLSSKFCNVRDFLKAKLQKYDGTNPRYTFLRENMNYIEDNGPVSLGAKLKVEQKPILSCTDRLGFPEQKITYSYFSDVIYTYYKYKFVDNGEYEELAKVLNLHNNSVTDKSVIPLFITQKKRFSASSKEVLESLSKLRIGDCENNAKWSLPAEVETERHELLNEAQKLIRFWTNEKYISIFFEKFVGEDDPRRKIFWLKYINNIERIRIVGSSSMKEKISTDSRLRPLLKEKFIFSKNNSKNDTAAIIMQIRGKIYIEFSEKGNALYVYQEQELPVEKLFSRTAIQSINSLKQTYMNQLIEIESWDEYHNEYGRMVHIGEWERRLSNYISRH